MKYLIVRKGMEDEELLFGGCLSHLELKNSLGNSVEILGAGICSFNWSPEECEWEVHLHQGSTSLKMDAKDEDKFYIKFALNF